MLGDKCCVKSLCLSPENPYENLSAETPDLDVFFGLNTGWYQNATPIGNTWSSNNCNVQVTSTISQQDADLKAAQLQIECTIGGDTSGGGGGGGRPCETNPSGNCVPLFQNGPALCTILCPDGLPFNFVFQAGQVSAPSQAEAQLIAQSLACIVGQDERLCLSAIPNGCLNQPYSATITTQGGTPPFSFTMIAGSLPPGLFLSEIENGLLIDGTPTSAGNYSFTIRVVDRFGVFFVKTYTLSVLAITNTPTAPAVNSPYAFSFSSTGGTPPYSYAITSGSLPSGLSMDSSGNITGTPTTAQSVTFSVTVTDSSS